MTFISANQVKVRKEGYKLPKYEQFANFSFALNTSNIRNRVIN